MDAAIVAVLDANVLNPFPLCDTLLRCALAGLYRPLWSAQILDDLSFNLIADGRATQERVERRAAHMRLAFPQAVVRGYEELVPMLTCAEKDRHVLAVAVRGKAHMIVTQNLGDFPASALEPYDITTQHPDRFLRALLGQDPAIAVRAVREQAAALRRPPMTIHQVLDVLALHVPGFVAQARIERDDDDFE